MIPPRGHTPLSPDVFSHNVEHPSEMSWRTKILLGLTAVVALTLVSQLDTNNTVPDENIQVIKE
jgi:hypothetical protein